MLNSSISILELVRESTNCGPRPSVRISCKTARTRSPIRKTSLGRIFSRGNKASALFPKSIIILSRVTFLTVAEISSPTRSRYISTTLARSASRTFCTITCLAVCAAMRPNLTDSICSTWTSPIFNSVSTSAASCEVHSVPNMAIPTSPTTVHRRKVS